MNDEQTPDVDELERALCSLPDVDAVRVVVDHKGRPVEVHVVAAPEKLAKQISRDVHSYALASLGVDLDRRIISVVNRAPVTDGASDEIGQSAQDANAQALSIGAIEALTVGARTTIRVTVTLGDHEVTGSAEGPASSEIRPRLVAAAGLDALRQSEVALGAVDVVSAQIVRAGSDDLAVVTLAGDDRPAERLSVGVAIVTSGHERALVRAVLDATNRR